MGSRRGKAVSIFQLFRYSSRGDKIMIAIAFTCSFLFGALQPLSLVVLGFFVNDLQEAVLVRNEKPADAVHPILMVFVYLGTVILVLAYAANCLWALTGERQAHRVRQLYVHAVLRQDMSWFDEQQQGGSLTSRLATDIQMIQDGISERFGSVVRALAAFATGFVVAFAAGWRLSVVVLAVLPVLLLVVAVMGRLVGSQTKVQQDLYAEAGRVAEQVFSGIRTVYAFSMEKRFADRYRTKLRPVRAAGIKRGFIFATGVGIMVFLLFGIFSLSFWYGGKLVASGDLEAARMMAAFGALVLGSMSLLQLPANASFVFSACGAAHKIYSIIDLVPAIDADSDKGHIPPKVCGDIEFRNVQFSYPARPDVPVLKNLSLNIKAGMTVAFVGPSGSGKSTTIQLLQRFYDPLAGQVLLDGRDIKDLNLRWLRNQIGVVSQEPVLFNMTVRQNILLGTTEQLSQEEIISACQNANCHSFITKLPQGYDTLVGEHGGMLSGGQKQRIAIARAILKNPSILLLDEATSALDTESERVVQRALDAASADRTTIVIAHRLSTVRNADRIVVLEHGSVIEQGTHKELVDLDGVYAQLIKKQEIAIDINNNNETTSKKRDEVESLSVKDKEADAQTDMGSMVSSVYVPAAAPAAPDLTQKAPIKQVLSDMRPEWPLLAFGCFGAAIAGAVFPVFAFTNAKCMGILMGPKDQITAGPLQGTNLYGLLFLFCAGFEAFGFSSFIIAFETAGERFTERLRSRLLAAYLKQDISFYDDDAHRVGSLTAKLASDSRNVNQMITRVWGEIARINGAVVTGLVIAFRHDWAMTLVVLAFSPVIMIATFFETRVQRRDVVGEDSSKTARAQALSNAIASEAIRNIRTVVALGKEAYFEAEYKKALEHPHRVTKRNAYLSSIPYALIQGCLLYVAAATLHVGMVFVQDNRIALQDMFVCMFSVILSIQEVGRCTTSIPLFVKAKASAISVYSVMQRKPDIDPDLEGIEPEKIHGDISFEGIAFRYPSRPDVPVFDGEFNLEAKAGQTIALVGPSGCGKSTAIGMLQRWYDPMEGTVRMDGRNIKNFTLSNLRSHMALVGQEPVLFDMTIGENIRFSVDEDKNITQEQVEEACRAANIHKFISSLPDGYNTRVGDKGSQLSGGQKQRIAIARALIRKPKVLLLDEATSALDSESEKLVQEAIDNIISEGGRTTVTIAHRLSTIQNADLICVIKHGRIVEQGVHQDLLRAKGVYSSLVRQQTLDAN